MMKDFLRTFFQQIPNGICLIYAIGSLVAGGLILFKRRHHSRFYASFWAVVLFIVLWRSAKGIISIRYASLLVYPAVILTAFAALRAEAYWRLLRKHFPVLPGVFGKILSLGILVGVGAGSLAMGAHKLTSDTPACKVVYETLFRCQAAPHGTAVMIKAEDAERVTYYTGAKVIPLGENDGAEALKKLNEFLSPNQDVAVVLHGGRKFEKLHFGEHELRPGARWRLIRALTSSKRKGKGVYIFLYSNPLTMLPATRGILPPPGKMPGAQAAEALRSFEAEPGKFHAVPIRTGGRGQYSFSVLLRGEKGSSVLFETRTPAALRHGEFILPDSRPYLCTVTFNMSEARFVPGIVPRGRKVSVMKARLTRLK